MLFAVFGRNQLRWSEIDPDWDDLVEGHRLGALSDIDADLFLRRVPIADPAIRAPIVQGAQGLPFYLDLQVSLYERLLADGQPPDPTHFGARRSPEDPDLLGLRHVLAQQIGRQGRYREAESESEFRAVWKGYVRVLGPDHPNTLRTRYWLAKVLDGQARHAEADDLPAGLEAQLLARFPETHRWVLDLREHLRQRGRS